MQLPLSITARANRPRIGGEVSSEHTEYAPADSPAIVTLRGSPPNAAMFSRVQRIAAS